MTSPSRREKLAFWLLLGLFSAAVPEAVSGSAPFVLFTPWGLFVTLPVYLLHAVFLAGLVYRYSGGLRFGSLYLAGALFGLYEAYLTKVLWAPTWDPIPVHAGGVYVLETVLLVLFWHPLMAFVVPLLVVEMLCTRSRIVLAGFPGGLRSRSSAWTGRTVAAGAVLLGLFQGTIVPNPVTALGSAVATSIVLAVAVLAWRRWVGADGYPLGELLPDRRELRMLGVLLAVMYVVYGAGLRREFLPGFASQATVWMLYLAFVALLVLRVRRDRRERQGPQPTGPVVPMRSTIRYAAGYVLAVGAGSLLLRSVSPAAFVVLYLIAFAVGGTVLVWIALGLRRPSTEAAPGGRTRRQFR